MHRVDRSNDAANVLAESLQISPDNPLTHFTLANVLAAMKDFQRSVFSSTADRRIAFTSSSFLQV